MADLKFEEDQEKRINKIAIGMYSREKEYVPFQVKCKCIGQVSERKRN